MHIAPVASPASHIVLTVGAQPPVGNYAGCLLLVALDATGTHPAEHHGLSQDHPDEIAALGADSDANRQLPSPATDRACGESIETQGGNGGG